MKPSFLKDGLPILATQCNLTLQEINRWDNTDQEVVINATDMHIKDGKHDSRTKLLRLVELTREKYLT